MFLRKRNSPRKASSEMDSGWRLKKRLQQPPTAPKQRFAKSKQPRPAVLDAWDDDDPWMEKASPAIGEPGKLSTSSSEDERVTVPKMARITPALRDEAPVMVEGQTKPVVVEAGVVEAGVVKAAAVVEAVEATEAKGAAIEEAKEKAQQCIKAISEARKAVFAAAQVATAYASLLAFEPPLGAQKTDA